MTPSSAPQTPVFGTLTDVSELIRRRQISPVELVTACLDRIERLQPQLNVFITVAGDAALHAARTAENELQQGRWKGPLHGIPVGIKDFYDTAGLRTTAAFERFTDRVPQRDAAGVEKLKRAGAIVIGKMNMHTLGMGTTGLESCFGPVKNPWNADYIPGGSSSGSAAAVASGLCYGTLDTDAIGSCRLPAACCGVVGYKGSYGLISMNGILDGEEPPDDTIRWMSHAGLTTRSLRDIGLLLDVLAEPNNDASAPRWDHALVHAGRLRIGIADNFKADEEISGVFENAMVTFRALGHFVRHVSAPFIDFNNGIANIERDRQSIGEAAFKDIDVVVLPTTATVVPSVKDAISNPLALSAALTMFANYYGLPAASVPCGFDGRGLPVGVQIVARPRNDRAVLQLAAQYEEALGFGKGLPVEPGGGLPSSSAGGGSTA
jgi:aspartyl-tRNA(Asn)/glutamyl-tRNA(Gln) amidotransferase subunit A